MKKLLSFLALAIFAVGLAGCFSSETTLEFVTLPDSIYELVGESGEIDLSKVEVRIDGLTMNLNQAIANGAIVTGNTFTSAGLHTLTIKYKTATISYNYIVNEEGNVVENEYEIDWYKDAPEGTTTFHISSANDLRGLAAIVNGTAKLGDETLVKDDFYGDTIVLDADIDLTGVIWTPIGEGTRKDEEDKDPLSVSFKGTFDGDGHIITGLSDLGYVPKVAKDYVTPGGTFVSKGYVFGLFGRVNGATIKNLIMDKVDIRGIVSIDTLTGQYISYNGDSVGAIAGFGAGNGDITIENCKAYGNIKGYDAVAGIFGRAYQRGKLTIKKCEADMQIVQTRYTKDQGKAAIIVGAVSGPSYFSIEECIARGSIDAGYNGGAGGIIGFLGSTNGLFKKCHNYATFSSKEDSVNSNSWNLPDRDKLQGGMFGFANKTSLNITFDECTSTGSVLFGEYEIAVDNGNGFGQLIDNIKSDTNENGTIILINGSQYNPIA